MELARPWFLLLLPVVALVAWHHLKLGGDPARLRHPRVMLMQGAPVSLRMRLARWRPWFSIVALVLLVIAASGPRVAHFSEEIEGEGIDIILSLDISGSMRSLDFEPKDRLEAAKDVIRDFITGRPHDRIGLVVFAAKAFTQCPLTVDQQVLTGFLDEVQVGLIDDGTAIGLGLATAVARLRHSDSPSKTVILLTDGVNNVPTLEPETAAELAEELGVRVYTVAIGREGLGALSRGRCFHGTTHPTAGNKNRSGVVAEDRRPDRRPDVPGQRPRGVAAHLQFHRRAGNRPIQDHHQHLVSRAHGVVRFPGPAAAVAGPGAGGHLAAAGGVRWRKEAGHAIRE